MVGSRRSASAVDRYVGRATHDDLGVYSQTDLIPRAAVRSIPGVRRADPATFVVMTASAPGGSMARDGR